MHDVSCNTAEQNPQHDLEIHQSCAGLTLAVPCSSSKSKCNVARALLYDCVYLLPHAVLPSAAKCILGIGICNDGNLIKCSAIIQSKSLLATA